MNFFSPRPARNFVPFVGSLKRKSRRFLNEKDFREKKWIEETVRVEKLFEKVK